MLEEALWIQGSSDISEASEFAGSDSVTCSALSSSPCVLVCEPDQHETEMQWWRDIMHFDGEFLFASDVEEARMLVAGNRGWMPTESRERTGRTGSVIQRIPIHDADGHSQSDYYVFWPKDRSNPYPSEFADVLQDLFKA